MREADAKGEKRRDEEELPPTASFPGSGIGPGSQIGRFRVEQELGRGGMGVVYLAHDTKLERPVAIKSLPADLMGNAMIRKRWKREAQVLASLNHPNIATIYEELEEAEGVRYLILEYVAGDTLTERIAQRGLKLQEALSIALQVAEAVAAAHEKDIIHRDLKPGNIKITPDAKVKVLDFGLAKVVASEVPDQQSTTTEPGKVIGTPAYMSPEQARGKPVDRRSDIWSFGCVLYEMLTGEVPFKGETASDTLANILDKDPDWQLLPQTTPGNIQVLLRRCLEKDPHRRLQHIGDVAIEIRETLSLPEAAPPVTTPSISLRPETAAKARSRRIAIVIGGAIIVFAAGIAVWLVNKKPSLPLSRETRLVVLPFENLGSTEDEYFADGMTEEIMSRLSGIHSLGVISRTSAIQYKNSNKTIQQIGKELGVEYVLEGTVRWERPSEGPSRVRVTPQLIRVPDDTHLWSDRYDAVLANIFEVQSDIAERVAQALDITLLEAERQALAAKPTEFMEAYDYYLRGNEYFHRSILESDFRIAIQMYEKAVELDPTFAPAYAQLSRIHVRMYWWYYDRSEERLGLAKQAVDKALQLNPSLPGVRLALGHYYYQGQLDYRGALEQFAIATRSQPNNSEVLSYIGYVQMRQGKFEQALANIKKASELDPLYYLLPNEVGSTLRLLRRYPEAERYYERAISLAPDLPDVYSDKAELYLRWTGSTEKARAVLEEALDNIKLPESPDIVNLLVAVDVYDGNYQEVLDRLSLKLEYVDDQFNFIPKALLYAQIYGCMDKKQLEQASYESAQSILETKVRKWPDDARFHSALGIAYAGLGRKEDAIREGKLAVELLPVTKDARRGPNRVEDLARIYVMVGEFDAAIDQIEFLLSIPGELSIPLLRLDPVWAPLREHPRFKKLLQEEK
jgi:serine/threonine protein kinase/tetratricopeptide (TPR) repeat protein